MKWYKQVDEEPKASVDLEAMSKKVLTSKMLASQTEPQFTLECQFLLAPHVLISPRTQTTVPLRDEATLGYLQESIVPHFNRCILFYEDGLPVSVTVSNLKDASKQEFESIYKSKELHPLILDLYGKGSPPLDQSVFKERPIVYQIDRGSLCGELFEGNRLVAFLQQTYLAVDGGVGGTPIGWTFGDHLRESVYLKFLSTFCSELYIYVWPSDGTVVSVVGQL
ncbi:hypothetical protein [Tumebacillus permanentifrigoris]|uniref:Uncharacterized protein n=1 Tax=Tumebacillus permanentifrigoris TaxID=378543 RepID=A0A316DB82_9BACL|nr:hypothetical protein [Tumebacillus permanentifrigoris]PWK13960.1 hypothetical protein C7459_106258 [Tumebacillus permanentifrigoris]